MYTKKIDFDPQAHTGLTIYLNDQLVAMNRKKARPFILVLPGGGYSFCSEKEAEPIALAFVAKGYHAGVLHYHVGAHRNFEHALLDAKRAMTEIKNIDAQFKVASDKIAVVGFSAGGHLAAAMSTLLEDKPSLCILGYPAILTSFAEVMKIEAPSLDTCVTPATPPTFLFSTFEDNVVPIENSLRYLAALEENGVPFESHIFQKGRHGLSLATQWVSTTPEMIDPRFARWFDLSCEWLTLNWYAAKQELEQTQASFPPAPLDIPLISLMKEEKNRRLLLAAFPKFANKSYEKIVRHYTLNQLHQIAPEIFLPAKLANVEKRIQKNM
ncbi:alpha/beta hydrolase [Enterococcus sp. DIV0876]|uniref:alpha/beta hydrolase n=1 Tax=Enterococcus sp. DIV0876 TaxID=2774633 RepID=UPI003D2FE651